MASNSSKCIENMLGKQFHSSLLHFKQNILLDIFGCRQVNCISFKAIKPHVSGFNNFVIYLDYLHCVTNRTNSTYIKQMKKIE